MANTRHRAVSQPIFHEPVFGDVADTPDPLGFDLAHPSDNAVYSEIQAALSRDVVGFEASRAANDALYPLADAYGARGADVVAKIQAAGRIVFHAVGDTGASDQRKYKNELRVADQLSMD